MLNNLVKFCNYLENIFYVIYSIKINIYL